ncbi:quinone oxidoreductase PIG3-like [Dendronephthya gigantea]|uniref:quinone oxidoreductase PIG3-like n=1 Tax=Dendronephthya gigantea TaxID=151771 RepID=UPI0010698D68|nr:quinone oxidoreductase PIG3-like [Dendronephthya gigantea]
MPPVTKFINAYFCNLLILLFPFIFFPNLITGEKTMQAVIHEAGGAEGLRVENVPKPSVQDGHILIRIHYFSINRADILQRKGLYPPPKGESDILGLEAAGVIDDISPKCSKNWRKGERVMALLGSGGYAEFVSVNEALVMPVPANLPLSDAAAIPEVWLTAYQLLHLLADVKSGEHVLVHAAGSGVGTAAIQLSKFAGAHALATAGSQKKLDVAEKIGAEQTANYKSEDFSEMVLKKTNGAGVEVILDCIGSSFVDKNLASIAIDGRWILYGLLGGANVEGRFLASLLRKRVSLIATTLRSRSLEYKKQLVEAFSKHALPGFEKGTLKPIVDKIFKITDIQQAHMMMESNMNIGKIVVEVREENAKEEL